MRQSRLFAASATAASAAEKVTFMTNWLAQAEHGGYYQAVADGTYAACGLDVTIMQGGPQVSGRPLLLAGKIDFYMGGNLLQAFRRRAAGYPAAGSSPPPSRRNRRWSCRIPGRASTNGRT